MYSRVFYKSKIIVGKHVGQRVNSYNGLDCKICDRNCNIRDWLKCFLLYATVMYLIVIDSVLAAWAVQQGGMGRHCPPTFWARQYRGCNENDLLGE